MNDYRRFQLRSAPRTVIGYHGCTSEAAEAIRRSGSFASSGNLFDWLGKGIYFWEYAPKRAWPWAVERCKQRGGRPVVIRATIVLGRCLNLLDVEDIPGLRAVSDQLRSQIREQNMPHNSASGAHYLDRRVIDTYCQSVALQKEMAIPFQTVRGSFAEGEPIFAGSKILTRAHTQIAVRDPSCIKKPTLVQWPAGDVEGGDPGV